MLTATSHAADIDELRPDKELVYAVVEDVDLKLDLYLPEGIERPPVVVYVHGGAWRAGSRFPMPLGGLVEAGFAVASVDYRLSTQARFPAQVHDIKAAIRYLRGRQKELGVNAERIGVSGASAGGHLAALVGMSNGNKALEGDVGDFEDESSDVQAIVSLYGMANLTTILDQSTRHGLSVRVPALDLLLGGQPKDRPELARLASPVFFADANDPPLLIFHGEQDDQAPIAQSRELADAYRRVKAPVEFFTLPSAGHGDPAFFDIKRQRLIADFLKRSLAAK